MEGFTRPDWTILPEEATVPDRNLITPVPNQFTHRLMRPPPQSPHETAPGRLRCPSPHRAKEACRAPFRQNISP